MGGDSDDDRGGWLLEDLEANIELCSTEKERKVRPYREKYTAWWLVLVDHIGYGLDKFDQSMFHDQVTLHHAWEKLILVNPLDPAHAFEI